MDLAGSEKATRTKATGERFKEGKHEVNTCSRFPSKH